MRLDEDFPISPAKRAALEERLRRLGVDLSQVKETFTKGGGKGGQKINKTSSRVTLFYAPMDLIVSCQRERQRSLNRFLALRELVDRIEMRTSPGTSSRLAAQRRARKQKDRRRRRTPANAPLPPDPTDKIG